MSLMEHLFNGGASDWSDYKRIVGQGLGIQEGIDALKGILKDDDNDD